MKICLDPNCIIYLVENTAVWEAKVRTRLAVAQTAGDQIAICDLARAECLIGPLASGDVVLLADYQRLFADPNVQMIPITAAVCERAAQIRIASAMRIKLPDAVHLAAAIEFGCGVFLTADARLRICTAITVEVLT